MCKVSRRRSGPSPHIHPGRSPHVFRYANADRAAGVKKVQVGRVGSEHCGRIAVPVRVRTDIFKTLRGTVDIDRKRRRSNPQEFAAFEAKTSNLPFAAILAGRNRLALREVWLPLLLGLSLALAAVALHPRFFGRSALPSFHG